MGSNKIREGAQIEIIQDHTFSHGMGILWDQTSGQAYNSKVGLGVQLQIIFLRSSLVNLHGYTQAHTTQKQNFKRNRNLPYPRYRCAYSRGVTLEVGLDCAGKIKEVEERPLSIRADSVCQLEIIAHVDRHAHTHAYHKKEVRGERGASLLR